MTSTELNLIESSLQITLPAAYRQTMEQFPVPAYAGNGDTCLWDDAAQLIEENLLLRSGAPGDVKPWPKHFFCLGRAGGGDVYAIDLRTSEASVWWVDHSILDASGSGQTHASFEEWLKEFVRDTIHDLECDGLAPDCSPEDLEEAANESASQFLSCLLWIAVIGLSLLIAVLVVTFFLN